MEEAGTEINQNQNEDVIKMEEASSSNIQDTNAVGNKTYMEIGSEQEIKQEIKQEVPLGFFEKLSLSFAKLSGVSPRDIAIFFRLISVLVNANVPILDALKHIKDELASDYLKAITIETIENIEKGGRFSDTIAKYEKVFGESVIGMVNASEESGNFAEIMSKVAKNTEKTSKLASKIKGAMMYPVIVIIILIGAFTIIMTKVVPELETVFKGADNLPIQTQMLIKISDFIVNYWFLVLGGAFGIIALIYIFLQTKEGQKLFDQVLLKMPVFGDLKQKIVLERFASVLSLLIKAGVPIIKTFDIVSRAVGSELYRRNIDTIKDEVSHGSPIFQSLKKSRNLYPGIFIGMIATGEEVSKLHEVSEKISEFYEEEIDTTVSSLTSAMEPLIIVVIGIAVGTLVWSIITPIMGIAEQVAG